MIVRFVLTIFVTAAMFQATPTVEQSATDSAPEGQLSFEEVEEKCCVSRSAIPAGHCDIQLVCKVDPREGGYAGVTRKFDTYWNADGSVRSIVNWEGPGWQRTSRALVADGRCFSDAGGNALQGQFQSIESAGRRVAEGFDPRMLGFALSKATQIRKTERSMWDHPLFRRGNIDGIFEAEIDDQSVLELKYKFNTKEDRQSDGTTYTGRIAVRADLGYNPILVERRYTSKDIETVTQLECSYQQVEAVGGQGQSVPVVWFPEQVVYRQIVDGNVKYEEQATISNVELMESIPTEMFTIAGLDITPGRPVVTDGRVAQVVADVPGGLKRATRAEFTSGIETSPVQVNSGLLNTFLIVNLVAVSVVIAYLFYRRRKNLHASGASNESR